MTLCIESVPMTTPAPLFEALTTTKPPRTATMFFYGLDMKHHRLFHVSSAASAILGYSSGEIIAHGLRWFVEQMDPDDLAQMNYLADHHCPSDLMPQIQYHFRTKTGDRCRLCEHRCLLYDADGVPSFMIARVERVV